MANYRSWRTGLQIDNIYPIGSIYMSVNPTDPGTLFGGAWQAIENTFLVAQGSSFSAGSTGGKINYTAADMPAHNHTRGTMNITGGLTARTAEWQSAYVYNSFERPSGAFTSTTFDVGSESASIYWVHATSNKLESSLNFDASRSWSGSTSTSGTNTTVTIMPPYMAVYMWQRIS